MNVNDIDKKHIWHPFTQEKTSPDNVVINSAKGVKLYTDDNKELIDYISSWWVNTLGHCNEEIAQAIYNQATTLEQVIFAGFTHPKATELSKELTSVLNPLSRVFFSDNGSTAVEVALKMAYQYNKNIGKECNSFLAFDGGLSW